MGDKNHHPSHFSTLQYPIEQALLAGEQAERVPSRTLSRAGCGSWMDFAPVCTIAPFLVPGPIFLAIIVSWPDELSSTLFLFVYEQTKPHSFCETIHSRLALSTDPPEEGIPKEKIVFWRQLPLPHSTHIHIRGYLQRSVHPSQTRAVSASAPLQAIVAPYSAIPTTVGDVPGFHPWHHRYSTHVGLVAARARDTAEPRHLSP